MEENNQEQEIREAITAADYALICLGKAEDHLNRASNWGVVDMLGGGLFSTMMKHNKMNEAEEDMNKAKNALRKFSRELEDVDQFVDFQFNVADFLSFADYFFDGLVADWLVQSKIKDARRQVSEAKQKVAAIKSQLRQMIE